MTDAATHDDRRALPPAALAELATEAPQATEAERAALAADGFVRVPGVLSASTVAAIAPIVDEVGRGSAQRATPMTARTVYQQAFLQEANVWQRRADIRPLVFSARIARLAAGLLGVDGVRLYHDQALVKEAGGGRTPWHCDQYYWPLATDRAITAWVPLQAVPAEMGPLSFRRGSHRVDLGRALEIGPEAEEQITRHRRWRELPVHDEPFAVGEVSFHLGWTFHGARPNVTDRDRLAMTMIYMPDGTRLTEPATRGQRFDRKVWLPGARVGEPIDSWLNPVVWSASGAHAGVLGRLPAPAAMVGTFPLPSRAGRSRAGPGHYS